ncbi:MAG: hypothetical protein BBJ57_09475 [Desulfobacterales bacterium PC51MH44]|nr:MAG: hypothetical protein BBJ57_09475 [Desulfobacterales bacterium PC51MH44]
MDISVILATYKRPEILSRTLESFCSLKTENIQWELIIVDNAGDQATNNVVQKYEKHLPIKFLVETTPGKNNALNSAIPEAKGELFIFTDDDIITDTNWLVAMWKGMKRWPDYSVFGGKITAAWPGDPPVWGGNHSLNQSLFALYHLGEKEKLYSPDDFLPYGGDMAIKKKIFDTGYRFNSNIGPNGSTIYRMGSETDLLKRLKNDGLIPVYLPNCIVQHQIRPEQLTKHGLFNRNFRIGFGDFSPDDNMGRSLFSASLYLWKQLVSSFIRYWLSKANSNHIRAFEYYSKFSRTRGKIFAQRAFQIKNQYPFIQKLLQGSI